MPNRPRLLVGKMFYTAIPCLFVFLCAACAYAQAPRTQKESYFRPHITQMAEILHGNHENSILWLEEYLEKHTGDQETLYELAVAHTRANNLSEAVKYVQLSVQAGLPFDRYYAGPRHLLKPLLEYPDFTEYAEHFSSLLVHGPMLGAITPTSALVKVRTADESSVIVRARKSKSPTPFIESEKAVTSGPDYTCTVKLEGLEASTMYRYEVVVDGKVAAPYWSQSFMTYPADGEKGVVTVGFGGGSGYTPWNERIWDTVRSRRPLAFIHIGDNVYPDNPEEPDIQRYCYNRRLSHPMYRRLASNTAIHAIWNLHDFAPSESNTGGSEAVEPPWKREVLNTFKSVYVNPYYGGGDEAPGVWHDFSIGDVDFFLLDARYHRTDYREPDATMLGDVQKKWLLEKLKNSDATFKVIASPVAWTIGTRGRPITRDDGTVINRGRDTWEGFQEEREEIFSFIEKNKIEGVFLISGDRHRSELWRIERKKGYPLYDAMSCRLTSNRSNSIIAGAMFSYNEKCSFGLLTFNTSKPDPELTYEIVNIENDVIHTLKLRRSQLSFGR